MPTMKKETDHYTAVIKIFRVDTLSPDPSAFRSGTTPPADKKDSSEVASINIRNNDLDALVAKAVAHLNLVEDNE